MITNRVLTPVYLIEATKTAEADIVLVYQIDGLYGVKSIRAKRGYHGNAGIRYVKKLKDRNMTIRVYPELSLFHGVITLPHGWTASCTECEEEQRHIIFDWVAQMNRTHQTGARK